MHKTSHEGIDFMHALIKEVGKTMDIHVVVCPPFTCLESISKLLAGTSIALGAQNMHFAPHGAHTGEISASMLKDLYVSYVILGHSERRVWESDTFIHQKVQSALDNHLKPILCVGESDLQRNEGKTIEVVRGQVLRGLDSVDPKKAEQVIVAYEPIWAIGTGKTPTPEDAQSVHAAIRAILAEMFDQSVANKMRILYGGSMNSKNAAEFMLQPDIDGGLVGGASLEIRSFVSIIDIAKSLSSTAEGRKA